MKRILMLCFAIMTLALNAYAGGPKNITSAEAKNLLAKNRDIFLLDVRTPGEFQQARLRGAVLIPISELEKRLAEVPKNKTILVYCAVGSRSVPAAGFLATKGFREVYNMTDGIVGWYRNGFPIDK